MIRIFMSQADVLMISEIDDPDDEYAEMVSRLMVMEARLDAFHEAMLETVVLVSQILGSKTHQHQIADKRIRNYQVRD